MRIPHFAIMAMLAGVLFGIVPVANAYTSDATNSPIVISPDTLSPNSQVNILIHAPDFNSNPYAIDTIGEGGSKVVISTREASIPYRLVETGPNTGDFAGYIILSSTTSQCSPVCGPTDGFLAAGGDDAIMVTFMDDNGRIIATSSSGQNPTIVNHGAVPEFSFAGLELLVGVMLLVLISQANFIRQKFIN